ncbi:MAG: hypothetical protein J6N67_01490 [Desulfovibrio sp.]|nr:hypothetical protein [Desulfovibrio sp.]MBO6170821.1 hypothetical protein [Desulfovibrio sp.]
MGHCLALLLGFKAFVAGFCCCYSRRDSPRQEEGPTPEATPADAALPAVSEALPARETPARR